MLLSRSVSAKLINPSCRASGTRVHLRAPSKPAAATVSLVPHGSHQPRWASRLRAVPKPTFKERWKEHWRLAKRDYPIVLPLAVVLTVASLSVLGLLIYDDITRRSPQFAAYPPAVEHPLRRALVFVHVTPDPDQSLYHFARALKAARAKGMDPYSPEVLGIRARMAEMLEKFGRASDAIEVLDSTAKFCEDKIADLDRGVHGQQPGQAKTLRKELLKTTIRSRVKTAALYESEYMRQPAKARDILSEAVGLLVKETQDPQTKGFSEDNEARLPLDEIASMLSQMGDLYATTGEESNAVQVYMLTLAPLRQACNGTKSCKEVQVLSNIAATMGLALKKPDAMINGQPKNKASVAAARKAILRWADQAIATAENVKSEDRDEICELSMLSAEMTKADLLLENGEGIQAKQAFQALLPRLREKNLDNLVHTAEQGIQRAV